MNEYEMDDRKKAHWELIKKWLDKKPKTTRYMTDEELARMKADVTTSMDDFKAWLKGQG